MLALVRSHKRQISIHAPCTGSDVNVRNRANDKTISIHAPCTGSDGGQGCPPGFTRHFNPRSLHGERPPADRHAAGAGDFNPRSLHGERRQRPKKRSKKSYFNPRSLHGERHDGTRVLKSYRTFQSTLPARGATASSCPAACLSAISIHAPCTGSDGTQYLDLTRASDFNPRSLHGERRLPGRVHPCRTAYFNPRSLHGERPAGAGGRRCATPYFNPRSLHGERPHARRSYWAASPFQSTLPARGATL